MTSTTQKSIEEKAREQMNIVIVGHVDHGKSTVVGRLLADTNSLPEGKLESVKKECERTGKPFEYAFLLDALSDEQDQGITIDTARSFFKTQKRDYIIIDAPGHIEFLKNMISGAARAQAAVLIIDAKEGVRENSRRHGYILSMLGINQVIVCVNKMDLINYDQKEFDRIEKEFRQFLSDIGSVSPVNVIPVSAFFGDNLAQKSDKLSWYKGPTLLEALDLFQKAPEPFDKPLRMPVQAIYKFTKQGDERRIVAGRIETGRAKVGDTVVFYPSNKKAQIKSIEAFNAQPRAEIEAGWSTGFTLSEEIYVTRGEVMAHLETPPQTSTRFRANLIWLGKKPLVQGRDYKLKIHTQALPVRLHKINKVIDASEAGSLLSKNEVGRHDVADVILETRQTIAFDAISDNTATGRFVLVDGYDIAGGGIIISAETDNQEAFRMEAALRDFNWIKGAVTTQKRAERFNHRSALVLFVGAQGSGKHNAARALEEYLFNRGASAYMLDAQNVLLGVDADLETVEGAQKELVRRFAEVSHILLDAGHIVISTSNAFALADLQEVQALLPATPILVISTKDNDLNADAILDSKTAGTLNEKILSLLQKQNILPNA